MCEICELLKKGKKYETEGSWGTFIVIRKELSLEYDKDFEYIIEAYGEGIAKMYIDYCPWCR